MPLLAIRRQIAGAVHLIIQIARMRDGMRRIQSVTEIAGMEGEVIVTQDLFTFEFEGEGPDGRLMGDFKSSGVRPRFIEKARMYNLDQALLEAMK